MDLIINHIPLGTKRPGKTTGKFNFRHLWHTIHNTANPTSTALNERLWLSNPSNTRVASWHEVVDDKNWIEAIPMNELAWHAGDFEGNNTSTGLEICDSGDREKTFNNAVKVVATRLRQWGWGVDRLRTHYSWSGKNCPWWLLPRWGEFIKKVKEELQMDLYEKWKQDIDPHLRAIYNLFPKAEEPLPANSAKPEVKYYVEGTTHIVEINPLDLKLHVGPMRGIDVKLENYINASFVWWEDYPTNAKPYATSILAYDGKLIRNAQPNGYSYQSPPHYPNGAPTPVFIIYKNGTVAIKDTFDLSAEISNIHLAVTVVQAYPTVREQGFAPYVGFSTVAYACDRLGIFYRKKDNKVILTFRKDTDINRLNATAKNLGVDFGGSLDSGGSANFIVGGKKINATTRWMASGLTW